jgi:outer membrane protein TolC
VLVGENPTGMTPPARAELPKLPDLPDTGVPADLLEQRPDVRAAARRVQAADRRVGAAIAARLPTIRLGATPGWTWIKAEIGGNFGGMGGEQTNTGFVWSVNATLNVPIFDGFQRTSQIHVRRAEVQEAIATYGQTLRQAMVEVENALAQERRQRERIGHLEKRVEVLGDTLEAARDRYRQGLSDFLPVLTALVNQQQAELDLLSGRRQVLSQRIQLHRALGGTWTRELDAPELEEVSQ